MLKLAKEIILGKRLKKGDDLSFFETADLTELTKGANLIRAALVGNYADLCTIINGKSGNCGENCKFCAQSACNNTDISEYGFLDTETILRDCKNAAKKGVNRYSIVTSGRALKGKDLDKATEAFKLLKSQVNIDLCASFGLLDENDFLRLKEAGVSRIHANIETSERFFPYICSTHTYKDKINTIKAAKKAGLEVCSGGIIGMGETFADRLYMALALSELEIRSIPINVLIPIKGTPLEGLKPLSYDETVRACAVFRYINPTAYVRIAGGRGSFPDKGRKLFESGVNAAITGDMLTTTGTTIESDIKMLNSLNFEI